MFECKTCNYDTHVKQAYDKHLATKKHIKLNRQTTISPKGSEYTCDICSNPCNSLYHLIEHTKLCRIEHLKKNPHLIQPIIDEIAKQHVNVVETVDTTEQVYTLQFYIGQPSIYDVNWEEFVNNVAISLEEDIPSNMIEKIVELMYIELDKMGVYKRPSSKEDKPCIKEDPVKEEEPVKHVEIVKELDEPHSISKVLAKYEKLLHEWEEEHPNWQENEDLSHNHLEMMNIHRSIKEHV